MKQLLLVSAVAVVAFSFLQVGHSKPNYSYQPKTYTFRNVHTPNPQYQYSSAFNQHQKKNVGNAQSYVESDFIKPYDHHEAFMGPSVTDIIRGGGLDRGEEVVLVGSALGPLMKAALERSYGSGMQDFKDISMVQVAAARQILESRVANGRHVSEKQFENLRGVEERLPAILDALAATFDENADTVYSLPNFFKEFDFDAVERAKFMARVVPTISRGVFQATETSTAENFRDAYNVFLPAVRQFLEDRMANGKPVTQQQMAFLERAERLMPSLMQAFVVVDHEPLLLEFMRRLNLDPTERAKYLVTGFFASMDAIFKNPNASVGEMMRDTTIAYMPASRKVFEDRLAQGKPVTQENFDNLERMEKTLPIIFDAYIAVMEDFGVP